MSVSLEAVHVKGETIKGQIYDIAQFNMTQPSDRLKAAVDSTGRIQLAVSQWSGWWWRGGLGATNYEHNYGSFILSYERNIFHYKNTLRILVLKIDIQLIIINLRLKGHYKRPTFH